MTDVAAVPQPRRALVAGASSVIITLVLLIIKAGAYGFSGAESVLASLLDSVCDASVSVMSLLAIHLSLKPADSHHRHGHGKMEALAALLQAAVIGGAGVFLLLDASSHLLHPRVSTRQTLVIVIMAASTVLALILIAIQRMTLKDAPSLAVEADKEHYGADIAVNCGVIVVAFAAQAGAPAWIDPAFAVLVALWLFRTTFIVAGKGADMVLDRELPDEIREQISLRISSCPNVLGMHDLRTFKSGMRYFISFDIEVDQTLSMHDAHEITREVERALLDDFPASEIMIHVDPFGDTDDARHQVTGIHT